MFNPENPPELAVEAWLNTTKPITLAKLKGRVVVLVAFQMLCPGCVSHALPQAKKLAERFSSDEVAVIGLHSVFEHHEVMTIEALKAFNHEYRWPFPIAVDKPDGKKGLPVTMEAYEMRGTPTVLLFDRQGRLRRHYLGAGRGHPPSPPRSWRSPSRMRIHRARRRSRSSASWRP